MEDPRGTPLQGHLWRWNDSRGLVSFCTGDLTCPFQVICIGGLTDGLLPCPWVPGLSTRCNDIGWSVVQPQISSSYTGYGTGSLERDSTEISEFVIHLKEKWGCKKIVIVGHSTGCQNAVHFAANGFREAVSMLVGIVLQAPVSDQEAGTLDPQVLPHLQWALKQPESSLDTLMPIESHYSPITVRRFLSLFNRYGDDDFFSSYLSDEELDHRFRHINKLQTLSKVLIAYSMADQYVPESVDKSTLVDRLVRAIGPKAESLKIPNADHSLLFPIGGSSVEVFVESVVQLLLQLSDS